MGFMLPMVFPMFRWCDTHSLDHPAYPGADPTSPGADPTYPGADTMSPGADPMSPGADPTSPADRGAPRTQRAGRPPRARFCSPTGGRRAAPVRAGQAAARKSPADPSPGQAI